ncbi:NB-ARC domain-containing protein [Paractinoplanes toevensis]|uniref:NB-ARC domain-containing protein n=1 Tax=Paractinoplanes toevensis TaxID=571911 RepID=UPI001FE47F56|nr:NB-ARC domain-containing protein [Actinoplanes toevensis]
MADEGARVARRHLNLPDPGRATTLDDLVQRLRALKVWAGDPSFETIKERVNARWAAAGRPEHEMAAKTTVVDCFRPGRRRVNTDLVLALVEALHAEPGYVAQWRQALQVVSGERSAAAQVRVQDCAPPVSAGFTGRAGELDRVRGLLTGPGGLAAVEGMAGVGKTQLALQAGHILRQERVFDRILFVDLRGFHPDPAQPPADPAAVLDGFLRVLGAPARKLPYDVAGRARDYRSLLTGTRTLVVLDNCADDAQVRLLLPRTAGCAVLITSRRTLTGTPPEAHLTLGVFTAPEALSFLTRAAPEIETGEDPAAGDRIADRCGHLPLALGLVTGHMRAKPGWTLTDHADWLDERHAGGRLETGIEFAIDLSYQHLTTVRRRVLRLLALHPGHDLDVPAAAALTGLGLAAAEAHLRELAGDHLLLPGSPGRWIFHSLVRVYALNRALDEDRRPEREAALARLVDAGLNVVDF